MSLTLDSSSAFAPKSLEEAQAWLRQPPHSFSFLGGGSKARFSANECLVFHTTSLPQHCRHVAEDMTVRVSAGTPWADLQKQLALHGQELPLDVAHPQRATVGGVVASPIPGVREFGTGGLRNWLIGLQAIDGRGRAFQAGGQVVKNVAGYDLTRLMIGSGGAFGLITELSFQVAPKPEGQLWKILALESISDLLAWLQALKSSACRPMAMEVLPSACAPWIDPDFPLQENPAPWRLALLWQGSKMALTSRRDQVKALSQNLPQRNSVWLQQSELDLLTALVHWPDPNASHYFQGRVPLAAYAEFLQQCQQGSLNFRLSAGEGWCFGPWSEKNQNRQNWLPSWLVSKGGLWRSFADSNLQILPPPQQESAWPWLQRLRQVFDPDHRIRSPLWPEPEV
ncbi:MAG: FAD-binding oxidoreductase [Planctomycetota bacterium]|nr:MAG: FAD-binding oxidoreductase [Planctomycetota bacterium]